MVALLVFVMATLFLAEKMLDDNVYKDPARYLCMALYPYVKGSVKLWLY